MSNKKLLIFIAMVSTVGTILADNITFNNYFTIGDGGNIRVKPAYLNPNNSFSFSVWAHFEGRLDSWWLEFSYPNSVIINSVSKKDGMKVPYLQSDGTPAICATVECLIV